MKAITNTAELSQQKNLATEGVSNKNFLYHKLTLWTNQLQGFPSTESVTIVNNATYQILIWEFSFPCLFVNSKINF